MAGRTKHQELLCNTLSSRLQAQVLSEAFWLQPVGMVLEQSQPARLRVREGLCINPRVSMPARPVLKHRVMSEALCTGGPSCRP